MIKLFCDACGQEIKPSELGNPLCTIQLLTPSPKGMAQEEKNYCASCTAVIKDAISGIKPETVSNSKLIVE
jgi:hypothetical protein